MSEAIYKFSSMDRRVIESTIEHGDFYIESIGNRSEYSRYCSMEYKTYCPHKEDIDISRCYIWQVFKNTGLPIADEVFEKALQERYIPQNIIEILNATDVADIMIKRYGKNHNKVSFLELGSSAIGVKKQVWKSYANNPEKKSVFKKDMLKKGMPESDFQKIEDQIHKEGSPFVSAAEIEGGYFPQLTVLTKDSDLSKIADVNNYCISPDRVMFNAMMKAREVGKEITLPEDVIYVDGMDVIREKEQTKNNEILRDKSAER